MDKCSETNGQTTAFAILNMDWNNLQNSCSQLYDDAIINLQKIPGSAIALRYVRSSYQNDPFRSAIELFLFLFAVRYLLAPTYSVQKQKNYVKFTDEVR